MSKQIPKEGSHPTQPLTAPYLKYNAGEGQTFDESSNKIQTSNNDYPITTQPLLVDNELTTSRNWVPPPGFIGIPSCPPGLENLFAINHVFVHQKISFRGVTGYEIKDNSGQVVYLAKEDHCMEGCCGGFSIILLDNSGNDILTVRSVPACLGHTFEVCAPPGSVLGVGQQRIELMSLKIDVINQNGDVVYLIHRPITTGNIFSGQIEFKILSPDGTLQFGKIIKHIPTTLLVFDRVTEMIFPQNADISMKGILLGICIILERVFK